MKRVCPFDVELLAFVDATDHVPVHVAQHCSAQLIVVRVVADISTAAQHRTYLLNTVRGTDVTFC
jgi:hypothetical protein